MRATALEIGAAIAAEAIGAIPTARWIYHHPAPKPTEQPFGWDWVDIGFSLFISLFWFPLGIVLLVAGAVAWSPRKKAN